MLAVKVLLGIGSLIIGILGVVHLVSTFFSNKFEPRDTALAHRLRQASPVLTPETTMLKAWIGFNASHSLGAILFAALYGYLAVFELEFLLAGVYMVVLSLLCLLSYLALAHRFWFRISFRRISISTVLFTDGYLLAFS